MLDLGTPDAFAAPRAAASATLVLGSAEPPATEGGVRRIGRRLGLETYNGLRPQCPTDIVSQGKRVTGALGETYPGGFAIYHRFLDVIDSLLRCNLGPLEKSSLSSQAEQFALLLCCDLRVWEWWSKMHAERGYNEIQRWS